MDERLEKWSIVQSPASKEERYFNGSLASSIVGTIAFVPRDYLLRSIARCSDPAQFHQSGWLFGSLIFPQASSRLFQFRNVVRRSIGIQLSY